MNRFLATTLILIATAALIAARPPLPNGPPPPPSSGPNAPHPPGELLPPQAIAELLDLTDAQKVQLAALREALRTTVEPLHEQQRANREQVEAAIAAGNAQRIGELVLANKAIRAQLEAARATFATSFEALLTSEQRAKWAVYEEIRDLLRPDEHP